MLPERGRLAVPRVAKAAAWLLLTAVAAAGAPAQSAQSAQNAPLPDVRTLLEQCRQHQRQLESVQENYTFRETDLVRMLNKDGSVKKTQSEEYEVFYVNTHEIRRLVRRDGKDLDGDRQRKEQERVTKQIARAQQTPPGQTLSGQTVISVGRILQIAKVSSPRREWIDGRSSIAFEFEGDPHAKTHGLSEELAKKTAGTVWIDEKDRQVRRMVVHLNDTMHFGFGFVSVGKGSNLTFDQKLVNGELWLPTEANIHAMGHAVGIFGFRANIHVTDSDYRRFHAEAEQMGAASLKPDGQ
jgi:hypothetical protein